MLSPVDPREQDAPKNAAPVARGSSFYTAMRILPPAQRNAMYAVYAFCRAVDDIADSGAPAPERLAGLDEWRADITRLCSGGGATELTSPLESPQRSFHLRQEDFLSVIDGMEMDARGDIRAPAWDELDLYCDRVASAVGRLSVRIFGVEEERGRDLAHHLGRALQMTNILRDVDQDAEMGRLYLPREALLAAGIDDDDPDDVLAHPHVGQACAAVAKRAQGHFAEAERIMACCPRKTVRAPQLMKAVYRDILRRLEQRGWAAPREEVHASKLRAMLAVLRYALV